MAEAGENRGGDRRGQDRRGVERRRTDRRTPPPPWRRPAAFAAYGATAAILAVVMLRGCGGDDGDDRAAKAGPIAPAPAAIDTSPTPHRTNVVEPALRTADFERLTLEGPRAVGRVVRAQLYCDAPTPVALMAGVDTVEAAIAPLVDRQAQRVPAAECKWGQQDDPRREDFLLLVPPQLATEFASQPVTMDGYIRRRRLLANVEWIGRSRALSLQTVGIFRGLGQ